MMMKMMMILITATIVVKIVKPIDIETNAKNDNCSCDVVRLPNYQA